MWGFWGCHTNRIDFILALPQKGLDWKDLEEVVDYIAKDSSHYAAAFVREARDAARTLAYLSERGRSVPEFNDSSIRELFVRSYRLIYQVAGQVVYIIGFIHGARDLWALWEREKR